MFKRKLVTGTIATVAVAFAGYSATILAANDDGIAIATILAPLTIAHTGGDTLDFGTIAPSGAVDVTVAPSGTPTVTSGSAILSGGGSDDTFTITGEPTLTYSISIPDSTIDALNIVDSMNVVTFTPAVDDGTVGTIPADGNQLLRVGATLNVRADQGADDYSGTYTVTINYN